MAAASANRTSEGPAVKLAASLKHSPFNRHMARLNSVSQICCSVFCAWFLQFSGSDIHAAVLHRSQDLYFNEASIRNQEF